MQIDDAFTACPLVQAARRYDWQVPDPRDLPPAEFRKVRDLIRDKVRELLKGLGVGQTRSITIMTA